MRRYSKRDPTRAGSALASTGHADRTMPSRAGSHVPAALAILRLAAALEPDAVEAMIWYRSIPIAVLDGFTAAELVAQGRAAAVITFLRACIAVEAAERRTPTPCAGPWAGAAVDDFGW
jgi:hypothetical protein